ncbi:MAG: bifunctional DNA primase/polymerase [Pseudonocardiaceae bacterium]
MSTTTSTTTSSTLLQAALGYAACGWRVFPLHPDSKRPACPDHRATDCDRSDPRCAAGHTGWEDRATTDPERIRRAWSSRNFGIGIACGPSGLVVLDLDSPTADEHPPQRFAPYGIRDGADMLAMLAVEAKATVPATYTVRTVSGGTHLYYQAPARSRIGNTAGSLGWLIDTRGCGGYVVAPPTTISGHTYTVTDDRDPAGLPGWLLAVLTQHHIPDAGSAPRPVTSPDRAGRYAAAAVAGETAKVRMALPGNRNHTLFCAAVALGQLVAGRSLADEDAHAALQEACAKHIAADAFTTAEAEATIRSGLATGTRNPRTAA